MGNNEWYSPRQIKSCSLSFDDSGLKARRSQEIKETAKGGGGEKRLEMNWKGLSVKKRFKMANGENVLEGSLDRGHQKYEIIVLQIGLWTFLKTNKIHNKRASLKLNILSSNVSLTWCNFQDNTFVSNLSFLYSFTWLSNAIFFFFFAYMSLY